MTSGADALRMGTGYHFDGREWKRNQPHPMQAAYWSHALVLTKYEAALPRAIREDAARKNRWN